MKIPSRLQRLPAIRDELHKLASTILSRHSSSLVPPSSIDLSSATKRQAKNDHIPRQQNAWILFRNHFHKAVIRPFLEDKLELHTSAAVSILCSSIWRRMSSEQQTLWYVKAKEEYERHKKLYPKYQHTRQSKPRVLLPKAQAVSEQTQSLQGASSSDRAPELNLDSTAHGGFDARATAANLESSNIFPTYHNFSINETSSGSILNFDLASTMMPICDPTCCPICCVTPFYDSFQAVSYVKFPSPETPPEMSYNDYGGLNILNPGPSHLWDVNRS